MKITPVTSIFKFILVIDIFFNWPRYNILDFNVSFAFFIFFFFLCLWWPLFILFGFLSFSNQITFWLLLFFFLSFFPLIFFFPPFCIFFSHLFLFYLSFTDFFSLSFFQSLHFLSFFQLFPIFNFRTAIYFCFNRFSINSVFRLF